MADLSADDLLALVDVFYQTALDPEGWDAALERFTSAFDGTAAVFFIQDAAVSELTFGRLWGRPADAMNEYESEFAALDIGVESLIEHGAGTVLSEEALPVVIRRSSRFFGEFREKWQIERYLAGTVFCDDRRVGVLAVQGEAGRRPFGDLERANLQRLLPHVRRAIQLRSQYEVQADARQSFEEVAEDLAIGLVLLDSLGEATFVNATARRVIARQDGLVLADRRLHAAASIDNQSMWQAIAAALKVSLGEAIGSNDAVTITRGDSTQPYNVLILPAGSSSAAPNPAFGMARVIVLIGDPDVRVQAPLELIARLYGLTPAEARLAHAIASGERLETYSERAEIAVSTARWRLKQIQAKTGCRRQVDLVRLLLTGPASLFASR